MLKQFALATLAAAAIVVVTLYLTDRTVLKHLATVTIGSAGLTAAVPSQTPKEARTAGLPNKRGGGNGHS